MTDAIFLYFAYGSNMSTLRVTASDRAPTARAICSGYVSGRRLTFDKVGRDGSAKCDCELTGNAADHVYGVVFEVGENDRTSLDRAEGKGGGYDATLVEVVAGATVITASTYFATNKNSGLKPYHWYKQHVLDGAREAGLPPDYVRIIEQVESMDDPMN
jgi:gamma-glutamylcyclotransferase